MNNDVHLYVGSYTCCISVVIMDGL